MKLRKQASTVLGGQIKKYLLISFLPLLSSCAQMQADLDSGPVCGQAYQDGRFYKACADNAAQYKWAQGICGNHKNGANPDIVVCLMNQGLSVTPDEGNKDITIRNR